MKLSVKLSAILFISGSISMIPNPLSKGYMGTFNEYKRAILEGIGMDADGNEDIIELKRSDLPKRIFEKFELEKRTKNYYDDHFFFVPK